VLVNLGPAPSFSSLAKETRAHQAEVFDRVVGDATRAVQACLDGMTAARWGRIVNVVSFHAFRGVPGAGAFAAAHGGLLSLTRVMAFELAGAGITANAIEPGLCWDGEITPADIAALLPTDVDPGLWPHAVADVVAEGGTPAAAQEFGILTTPARPVTATELAGAVEYLVGPYGASVTGLTVHVNGGMHLGTLSKKPGHPPWAIT
jgi:3-hydroxybutyrate dehydrogenase